MTDISQETHDALLQKAVADATAQANAEVASLKEANAALISERDTLTTERASLLADNERLNGDLDKAQVSLKTVTDEVAALKSDIAAKDEAAQKAEIAAARATQVKNLGLFPEEYISEKASRWADVDEAAWTERIEEWKAAKGDAPAAGAEAKQDAASALTGTDEASKVNENTTPKPNAARRAVLGLV
jgi:FtsZ-binding cell division protein ZapB